MASATYVRCVYHNMYGVYTNMCTVCIPLYVRCVYHYMYSVYTIITECEPHIHDVCVRFLVRGFKGFADPACIA